MEISWIIWVRHRNGSSYDKQLIFYKADPDYGRRVAEGLGLDMKEVERLAKMSHEERAKARQSKSKETRFLKYKLLGPNLRGFSGDMVAEK